MKQWNQQEKKEERSKKRNLNFAACFPFEMNEERAENHHRWLCSINFAVSRWIMMEISLLRHSLDEGEFIRSMDRIINCVMNFHKACGMYSNERAGWPG